jgi:uncharacterized repeat protein (TIGR03803 family)
MRHGLAPKKTGEPRAQGNSSPPVSECNREFFVKCRQPVVALLLQSWPGISEFVFNVIAMCKCFAGLTIGFVCPIINAVPHSSYSRRSLGGLLVGPRFTPTRKLERSIMKKLGLWKIASIVAVFCVAMSIVSPAQTFKVLVDFNDTDGAYPTSPLVQGLDGNFYGATGLGGANFDGTIFKISATGTLTTLYSFCSESDCADGYGPSALVLGTDGNFYGTTGGGGATSDGTAFKITPQGMLTTLHTFCSETGCRDGSLPVGPLVQASDGNFYGTTDSNAGTVFKMTPQGALTTLYYFCSRRAALTATSLPRGWL